MNRFVDAAACGDLDAIKDYLLDSSLQPEVINMFDKDGRSSFHYSCLNDDVPLLQVLMADSRVNVNLISPNHDTGLHMAALYASLEAMKIIFVDGRINLNAQNKHLETPLHLCAGSGDKGAAKAAKLLLEAGASLAITDKWHRGPLDVSHDNAENPIVQVFNEWLDTHPEQRKLCEEITAAYKAENSAFLAEQNVARMKAKNAIFGALGGLANGVRKSLKKTVVVEKSMFRAGEGSSSPRKASGINNYCNSSICL